MLLRDHLMQHQRTFRGWERLTGLVDHELPAVEFAFPGPLRDRLVAAILAGAKTSTTSLLREYEVGAEPLPVRGERGRVVDSAGRAVCVIETTAVAVVRLADVSLAHALAEGEGFTTVAEWRTGHERFWRSPALLAELGGELVLDDDTLVVLEEFAILPEPAAPTGDYARPDGR